MMNKTVLVCDDAVFMRMMLADILRTAGFLVVGEAENGVEAVEQYKALRPDLVIMDILMPQMDGIEAVRSIMSFDPDAKIVMCTAMERQALVVDSMAAGAKEYIVKPFLPSRVIDAIRRVAA